MMWRRQQPEEPQRNIGGIEFPAEVINAAGTHGVDLGTLIYNFLIVQLGRAPDGRPNGVFRPWQVQFLQKPFAARVGCILQLPPGAGKTLLAQWVLLEHLLVAPAERVIFAVPLRTLAKQLHDDVQRTLAVFNALHPKGGFSVGLAEGPGARVDLDANAVVVATYEHAAGELRRAPQANGPEIGLLVVDEIHNIAKADRGPVIDDLLFFAHTRTKCGFPCGVLGMSGTLEGWVSERLLESYTSGGKPLFEKIHTPEALGIPEKSSGNAARRLTLPQGKFGFTETCVLARNIVKDLLDQRLDYIAGRVSREQLTRCVAFFSSVSETEAAFLAVLTDPEVCEKIAEIHRSELAAEYAAPAVKLAHEPAQLFARLFGQATVAPKELELKDPQMGSNMVFNLNKAGVYLHHAQLKGQRATDHQKSWQDELQEQLGDPSGDFVAVFCTSTLSVGVNLNSTQLGLLGPNTMWSIDQAEQMIGRVGRVNRDAQRSVVLIVDSPKYTAPGCDSLCIPAEWFVPRLVATLEFAGQFPGGFAGQNLEIRGFFRPAGAPGMQIPDTPGGTGVLKVAIAWNLIDKDTKALSETAADAIAMCKQDLKSLPCTDYLLNHPDVGTMPVVVLWALLIARLPGKWNDPKIQPSAVDDNSPFLTAETPGVRELIELYGHSHAKFPGDTETPGRATIAQVLSYANRFLWCAGAQPHLWPYSDPIDLIDLAGQLHELLDNSLSESNLLALAVNRANSSGDQKVSDLKQLHSAFQEASIFCLLVHRSVDPPQGSSIAAIAAVNAASEADDEANRMLAIKMRMPFVAIARFRPNPEYKLDPEGVEAEHAQQWLEATEKIATEMGLRGLLQRSYGEARRRQVAAHRGQGATAPTQKPPGGGKKLAKSQPTTPKAPRAPEGGTPRTPEQGGFSVRPARSPARSPAQRATQAQQGYGRGSKQGATRFPKKKK